MQLLAITAVIVLLAVWMMIRLFRKKAQSKLVIGKRKTLLDTKLHQFKKQLSEAFTDEFDVYPRVNFAELLVYRAKPKSKADKAIQEKIATTSVDFVLVDQRNGDVICVVQLDQGKEKTATYQLVAHACRQAKLALIHFDLDEALDASQIRQRIMSATEPTIRLADKADGNSADKDEIKIYLEPVKANADVKGEVSGVTLTI